MDFSLIIEAIISQEKLSKDRVRYGSAAGTVEAGVGVHPAVFEGVPAFKTEAIDVVVCCSIKC